MATKETLLKELNLEPHVEGGYFFRTYTSPRKLTREGSSDIEKATMSSIFYMLTRDSPVDYFHVNISSDIVHYFHLGLPIKYIVVTPEAKCSSTVLGHDVAAGQKLQLTVPSGCWKAAELVGVADCGSKTLDYGLISEAVSPEFRYKDWRIATEEDLKELVPPEKWNSLKCFVKPQ